MNRTPHLCVASSAEACPSIHVRRADAPVLSESTESSESTYRLDRVIPALTGCLAEPDVSTAVSTLRVLEYGRCLVNVRGTICTRGSVVRSRTCYRTALTETRVSLSTKSAIYKGRRRSLLPGFRTPCCADVTERFRSLTVARCSPEYRGGGAYLEFV